MSALECSGWGRPKCCGPWAYQIDRIREWHSCLTILHTATYGSCWRVGLYYSIKIWGPTSGKSSSSIPSPVPASCDLSPAALGWVELWASRNYFHYICSNFKDWIWFFMEPSASAQASFPLHRTQDKTLCLSEKHLKIWFGNSEMDWPLVRFRWVSRESREFFRSLEIMQKPAISSKLIKRRFDKPVLR